MAIAFDTKTSFTFNASASNITYSHTCSGSDRILFVGVSVRSTRTVTSVTYNGVAMSQSGSTSGTTGILNYLFYLVNPTTGTNTVSITQSAADTITSSSISYTGARQILQPDATSVGGPTTTTSYSQSVTTIKDNCWAVLYGDASSGAAITAGSNTIVRNQPEIAFTGAFLIDTNSAKTPNGVDTLNVTSSSQSFSGCMASFSTTAAVDATLTVTFASFILDGFNAILNTGLTYILSISKVDFLLTSIPMSLILRAYTRVTNLAKHATTVTNMVKNTSASVTNRIKHSLSVTNRPKS